MAPPHPHYRWSVTSIDYFSTCTDHSFKTDAHFNGCTGQEALLYQFLAFSFLPHCQSRSGSWIVVQSRTRRQMLISESTSILCPLPYLNPVFVSMWRSGDRPCLKYLQVRDTQCVKTLPKQVRITSWQKSLANLDYRIPPLISCPCKFQHIQIYANVFEYVRLSAPQTG